MRTVFADLDGSVSGAPRAAGDRFAAGPVRRVGSRRRKSVRAIVAAIPAGVQLIIISAFKIFIHNRYIEFLYYFLSSATARK